MSTWSCGERLLFFLLVDPLFLSLLHLSRFLFFFFYSSRNRRLKRAKRLRLEEEVHVYS